MKEVGVQEAKTHFSRLLRRVAAGEEITVVNRGVPVERLVPVSSRRPVRQLGAFRNLLNIPDDFDAPLPDEILDAFEGRKPPGKAK